MRQGAIAYFIVLGIGAALVLFGAWNSLQNPWSLFSLLAGVVLLLSYRWPKSWGGRVEQEEEDEVRIVAARHEAQEERRLDRAEESLRRLREEDERRIDRQEKHAERVEDKERDRDERQDESQGPSSLPMPGQKSKLWKEDDQA